MFWLSHSGVRKSALKTNKNANKNPTTNGEFVSPGIVPGNRNLYAGNGRSDGGHKNPSQRREMVIGELTTTAAGVYNMAGGKNLLFWHPVSFL